MVLEGEAVVEEVYPSRTEPHERTNNQNKKVRIDAKRFACSFPLRLADILRN